MYEESARLEAVEMDADHAWLRSTSATPVYADSCEVCILTGMNSQHACVSRHVQHMPTSELHKRVAAVRQVGAEAQYHVHLIYTFDCRLPNAACVPGHLRLSHVTVQQICGHSHSSSA